VSPSPRVGVVGGGVLGATLTLRLQQAGAQVTLVERAPTLGGLAGAMEWGGHTVDRFYHVIVPTDEHMIGMAKELGLGDDLEQRPVGAGFYIGGELRDFNGVADLLRFDAVSPLARARMAYFVAQCQVRGSVEKMDRLPLERWLRRQAGRELTEKVFGPLFDSRYEGEWAELPATFLWSRTRRQGGTRRAKGDRRETMGALRGGHQRLIDAIVRRAQDEGAELRLGTGIEGLERGEGGAVTGLRTSDGEVLPFDLTIATLQPPALRGALPEDLLGLLDAYPRRYLGVVCLLLKVREPILPYYAVNICDPTPITTVVEAAEAVGTEHTDGLRLVYVPRYCDSDSPTQKDPDDVIYDRFISMVERMAPSFSRADVVDWTVQRARLVEPVHPVGQVPRTAPVWPGVDGLALASASQIYPRVLSGDSVIEFAEGVAAQAGERLGLEAAAR
jgi:protoporphyrinogen oxidase